MCEMGMLEYISFSLYVNGTTKLYFIKCMGYFLYIYVKGNNVNKRERKNL